PMADHLVVQNHEIKDWFTGYNNSIQIIPNPVEIPSENLKSTPEISLPMGKLLVAMGRMVKLKGFDILIEIFARLHKNHKDWNLLIIGTGHLEEVLKQQTKQLGIKEYVYFPGKIVNPFSVLVHCDLFVLSSLYEGFPNALLEAMACGLPVISFDCPSGPSEIIQNEINGLLVPAENKDALEKALDKMMQNEELRKKLGRQAIKVYDKYTPKKIMPMWEKLLSKNL
ncbi:MAG: glycosyltransferase, partial [Thermodesulfobacteriota bacterium]|nr:glycosyltransferase [Thermodesulfobacteriota bacterium]